MEMRAKQPTEKAMSVVATKVNTMKVVERFVDMDVDFLGALLLGVCSGGARRATSSLLLSSSIVMLDGDGLRRCSSTGFFLGHMTRMLGVRSLLLRRSTVG